MESGRNTGQSTREKGNIVSVLFLDVRANKATDGGIWRIYLPLSLRQDYKSED